MSARWSKRTDLEPLGERIHIEPVCVKEVVEDVPEDRDGGLELAEQPVRDLASLFLLGVAMLTELIRFGVQHEDLHGPAAGNDGKQIGGVSVDDAERVDAEYSDRADIGRIKKLALGLDCVVPRDRDRTSPTRRLGRAATRHDLGVRSVGSPVRQSLRPHLRSAF